MDSRTCLVIGAGISGLTAARDLAGRGWQVTVLDKGRGVGGRMATRRIGHTRADHGAQFFTTRTVEFAAEVAAWESAGLVSEWYSHDGHMRYRVTGGMSALAKSLATNLDVRTGVRVTELSCGEGQWRAVGEGGESYVAGAAIVTAPVEQALALVPCVPAEVAATLRQVEYDPCFALIALLDGPSAVPAPGWVRPEDGAIAWIADNAQKGLGPVPAALTIHATPEFTRAHYDAPQSEVAERLLDAAREWLGGTVSEWQLHRWRYSQPKRTLEERAVYTASPAPVAFAGDAFGGPRVEGAFLSGLAAAERIQHAGR